MRISLRKWILIIGMLAATNASAQLLEENLDQYDEQSQGNYQPMNLNYAGFSSLGMIQSAWQDPLQNLGEGQSKPAYSKYYWTPDLVLPIRLREAMLTLVNFPEWELIEDIHIGDTSSFGGEVSGPNTILLFPQGGATVGVDTNIIVFGRSGNKYVFYVKSEGVNTERLTNSIIDIDVVGGNGASGGSPSSSSGVLGKGGSGRHVNANNFTGGGGKSVDSTFTKRFQREDWLKSIPLDPTKFRFDIEIYVPNPDDVSIAPERVWRDDIFTYIDLGEKALNMVQRPIVTLIVEQVETPVGFRTKGPNNRLIIVEGVGDMVMRSGKRMVCLKLRRSDSEGLQYATYADTGNDWDVAPAIPGGAAARGTSAGTNPYAGGASGNATAGVGGNIGGVSVENGMVGMPIPVLGENGGAAGQAGTGASGAGTTGQGASGDNTGGGGFSAWFGFGSSSGSSDKGGSAGVGAGSGVAGVNGQGGIGGAGAANTSNVDYSRMAGINASNGAKMQNPYPEYKFGSGFSGQSGENLSIELGTDANVNNLETLWKDLSGRYSTLLGGYEPFYSVDAPADGQGKELFHLRVGPLQSLESGDAVCSQLGRSGIFCSVVRMQ